MEQTTCPMCQCPVRIERREDGAADHYEFIEDKERDYLPNPISSVLEDYLRAKRKGKRTVAMVGADWSSGPWAPFGEIEVWGMNLLHNRPWFKTKDVTRWFQMHPKWIFTQDNVHKHWEWLQKEHPFPIYMHMVYDDIPSSVKYPLREIQNNLTNIVRGETPVNKIFSSSFSYQIALAIHENFERIEIYGVSLLSISEYAYQRESLSYWMGKADGLGIEVWLPETCALLIHPLYGYEEVRSSITGEVIQPPSEMTIADMDIREHVNR